VVSLHIFVKFDATPDYFFLWEEVAEGWMRGLNPSLAVTPLIRRFAAPSPEGEGTVSTPFPLPGDSVRFAHDRDGDSALAWPDVAFEQKNLLPCAQGQPALLDR